MHLLQLESSPGWGGQEIRILQEALALREKGHKIIFAVEEKSALFAKAKEKGFSVYKVRYKKKTALFAFLKLLQIMRKEKIHVINTHSSLDSWIGGIAARLLQIPIVRTRHLSTPIRKGINSRWLYHGLADFVVTTCEEVVPVIIRQAKKPISEVRSVPTGVKWEDLIVEKGKAALFRTQYIKRSSQLLVGMVCFMRSWKGVDTFIEAARLAERNSDLQWIIIGGGHEEIYREKVRKLGLRNFHFTGHIPSPFYAIEALDIFSLLSTAHEGVSQASLQAAYLKKPLITTETGGLKEVCITGKTGIQVKCHSPKEVYEAVCFLQNNPQLRKTLGENGHLWVKERFSWRKTVQSMEEIYTSVSLGVCQR